jgi:hypothetical protein
VRKIIRRFVAKRKMRAAAEAMQPGPLWVKYP